MALCDWSKALQMVLHSQLKHLEHHRHALHAEVLTLCRVAALLGRTQLAFLEAMAMAVEQRLCAQNLLDPERAVAIATTHAVEMAAVEQRRQLLLAELCQVDVHEGLHRSQRREPVELAQHLLCVAALIQSST